MLLPAQTYEEACRTFRWRIPEHYNQSFDLCDRHTLGGADGHRTALIVEAGDGQPAERYSFITLRRLASRLGAVLTALGVVPGDRVAISLPQSLEAAVCLLAVPRMGAVMVPVPVTWDDDGLMGVMTHAKVKVAILATPRAGLSAVASLKHTMAIEVGLPAAGQAGDDILDFWAALERVEDTLPPALTHADDPAALWCSGIGLASGQSVLHAHRAVLGNLPAVEFALDFFTKLGDVMWTSWDWMSFEGAYWGLFPAWHHGVPVLAAPAFQPNGALDWMASHGVRVALLPPDHLLALAEAAAKRSHVLPRALATGPDPLSPPLLALVEQVFGVPANEIWGVAATGALAANNANITERRIGSPGRMLPGISCDAAIVSTGGMLAAGTPGVLAASPNLPGQCLRGPYDAFRQGWNNTGWTGLRDLDGYVWPDARPGVVIPVPEAAKPTPPTPPPLPRLDGVSPKDRW